MSKPLSRRYDDAPFDPAERRGLFTVHVRATGDRRFGGRVTHAATGDVTYFDSPEELIRYLIAKAGTAT